MTPPLRDATLEAMGDPTEAPELSVILPAWNEAEWIGGALDAVYAACAGARVQAEVIVTDNASSDATARIARERGARVVYEPERRIARARNAGAAAARGRFLLFVDADTWPDAELLNATLRALRSGEVCGGGAQVRLDQLDRAFYRWGQALWNHLSRALGVAAGCYLFCTREAFDAAGGFSERVYAGEEVFLSRRLARQGRRRGQAFRILAHPVQSSGRKARWFSPWRHLWTTLVLLLVPFALRSRRFTRFWYHRP